MKLKTIQCDSCGKKIQRYSFHLKRNTYNYCSQKCFSSKNRLLQIGQWTKEKNPKWNNGKTTFNGYIAIFQPDHPNCNKRGYVYEHRLVMEKHLGRYLKKKEVVHHIDGNKKNNDINNLMLFPTHSAHIHFESIKRRP